MPKLFKQWDQNPKQDKSCKDIIKMYEGGFAGALYSEEEKEALRDEAEYAFGTDAAHAYGFADNAKGKLVVPFVHVLKEYPESLPGPGQTRGSCFKAGAMVLMADGSKKPIEQISIGDKVITHLGNTKTVTHLITKSAEDGLLSVSVSNYHRSLVATPDHEVPVIKSPSDTNFVKKQLKDVKKGEYLVLGKPNIQQEDVWFDMTEYGCDITEKNCKRNKKPNKENCRSLGSKNDIPRFIKLDHKLAYIIVLFTS